VPSSALASFRFLSNISNSAVNLVTSASYFAISFGFAFSNPLAAFSFVWAPESLA
jgi:hypothetical protein